MTTLNPNYDIEVEGTLLDAGIRELITSVEYESADGVADVAKINLVNPDFVVSDNRVLLPGNEVSIWMGYGNELSHVGRVKIYKVRPNFPKGDEMPTIEVVGYTRDHDMMHRSPPQSNPRGGTTQTGRRGGRQRPSGRRFRDVTYAEAVEQRASDYGFTLDIDATPDSPTDFIQRAGMSDYDFVVGLSNITGYVFWVDADESGVWTLHFKDPTQLRTQDRIYTFEYNVGDDSSLLSFEPEFLVTGAVAEIRVRVTDPRTGVVMEAEFNEDNEDVPDVLLEVDEALSSQEVQDTLPTSSAVQLFIGDFSFQEMTSRAFRTEAELENWARQWFRRQREHHIMADGSSIGVETLVSRQTHEVSGVGSIYSGSYYFSRVRHRQDEDNGYLIDFSCRKQVPELQS